jgi:hypothetical protein
METTVSIAVITFACGVFLPLTIGLAIAFARRFELADFAARRGDEFPWSFVFVPRFLYRSRREALDALTLQLGCMLVPMTIWCLGIVIAIVYNVMN